MLTIEFTPLEMILANILARARNDKPASSSKKWVNGRTDFDTHLIGVLGEMAFSKASGILLNIQQLQSGDDFDFSINGCTMEIKVRDATEYPHPDLLCRCNHANSSIYILAYWSRWHHNAVHLVGWCKLDQLKQNKINLGYGERYIVESDKLQPIDKLIKRIKEVKANHTPNTHA